MRALPYKLVEGGGRKQLFNLREDPGEERDLADEEPRRVERLSRELTRYRSRLRPLFDDGATAPVDPGLRATPYLSVAGTDSQVEPTTDENALLPHPQDRMRVVSLLDDLRVALSRLDSTRGPERNSAFLRVQQMQARLDEVDQESPAALFWSGRSLVKLATQDVVSLRMESRLDLLQRATARFQSFLQRRPRDLRTLNMSLIALYERGRLSGESDDLIAATEAGEEQRRRGLADGLTHALLGRIYAAREDWKAALEAFRRAVEEAPDRRAFRADLEGIEQRLKTDGGP